MKGFHLSDRPAYQRFYEVAGRLLFITSDDLRLGNLIERLFAGWLLTPIDIIDQRPDLRIDFYSNELIPEIPKSLDQFEIAKGGRCYTNDNAYYLDFSNSLMFIQGGESVDVALWIRQLPGFPDAALARATSSAVCAGLRRCGLFELHSAGVVHPDCRRGVLIIGASGSGKSTLTLQLAKAGWGYLSDDGMLLGIVEGEVEARGFRRFFAVSADTTANSDITDLKKSPAQPNDAVKTCFEPTVLFPSGYTERIAPSVLLFTTVSGEAGTKLTELTQARTMARLIRACPWATYDRAIAAANLHLFSRLSRQCKGFDVLAGKDLLEPLCASALLTSRVGN
jgi:hypothetical protein